ncbi:flagellar motor protein MotB [Geotalea sp. SG265]|uniref:OmpA/MotB family protein n=1 Tax=Geotalea sp. SG265 TaxID=2922867 RepID=UPI001FAF28FF|nr:flagellar motor protein MotB [Geotalea sp. SG265]
MRFIRTGSMLLVALMVSGCVSMSKYNEKVQEVAMLRGDVTSLEENLAKSEAAGKALQAELQKSRENLAKLEQEHENLKAEYVAMTAERENANAAMGDKRQAFSSDMEALTARLNESETRVKELTALLTAQEQTAQKVPELQAAVADREERIKTLNATLRSLKVNLVQIRSDVIQLAKKRSGSEEKENAYADFRRNFGDQINKGEILVTEYPDKMIVTLPEQVLFRSGSATINRSGRKALERVAGILKKVRNNRIRIEGHTDSTPIRARGKYASNWDLSAARAASVVRYLQRKGAINPELLTLAGYGPYAPAAANNTSKGRSLNRRIEIALIPMDTTLTAEATREKLALR